jgi:uncharacterized protein (DUF169 family)
MKSVIASAIGARFSLVAIVFTDEAPEGAVQFAEGKWGCVMWLYANAARGRTGVASSRTFGCRGGGTGLGFGNQYESWPGGIERFYRFLSTGDRETPAEASSREHMRRDADSDIAEGERYIKSPELAHRFVDALPMIDVPTRYVALVPLDALADHEKPEVIVFTVDADQLAALVVLANYARPGADAVTIPFAAGCQAIGILPYAEAHRDPPRAVVGLVDLSARKYVARQLGKDVMTFAVPFAMFREMESNVPGSFLEREPWITMRPSGE